MIKVIIKVETDSDFTLSFPKNITGFYDIKYDGNYFIKICYEEKNALDGLVALLSEIEISSCKDWHSADLKKGISGYINQLNTLGLSSSIYDLIGGGNWSFTIDVLRITEQYVTA